MKYFLSFYLFIGLMMLFGCSGSGSGVNTGPRNTTAVETCYDVTITRAGASQTQNICTTRENGGINKLGVSRFVKFTLNAPSTVNILVTRTSGLDPADPDIVLFRAGESLFIEEGAVANREAMNERLTAGNYIAVITEYIYANQAKPQKLISPAIPKEQSATIKFTTQPSTCSTASNSTVSGEVVFERVKHKGSALDFNNIQPVAIQEAVVEVICDGGVFSSSVTDSAGAYSLSFPNNQASFVRVEASMQNGAAWDIRVVDNTNNDALYVMDSAAFTQSSDLIDLNLTAQSGWGGTGYIGARVAAPFAILDSVRKAKDKVLLVTAINLPPLQINWSPNNSTSPTSVGTSFYENSVITLLGAENSDTDEYDEHVIIHEWGHYFEDLLSRSDSAGGNHTTGDILDFRVAFSEGFGNAFSAMVTDDPIYNDSSGLLQNAGFTINMENNNCLNAGWYSECSVQSILYDIYDAADDGTDTLELGFTPFYNVFIGAQKNTQALTSIFSFIKPLKDQNSSSINVIDAMLGAQFIDPIIDIYGAGQITSNPGDTDQL
ncbi:Phage tail fiber protein, partial [hydrothermal vent metagenome]